MTDGRRERYRPTETPINRLRTRSEDCLEETSDRNGDLNKKQSLFLVESWCHCVSVSSSSSCGATVIEVLVESWSRQVDVSIEDVGLWGSRICRIVRFRSISRFAVWDFTLDL
ncbi:hypothetical protein L2E82_26871 [Cichorium intybus]|uniref:Uncharacterized protein n=1 Tax=Cichorium intybus TaxID=13427 RepID=A0ACB9CRE4_CICIN|nr:hypothetical protein L2E82_26871 [Cichorium intybus]